jgi:hypothetical protein
MCLSGHIIVKPANFSNVIHNWQADICEYDIIPNLNDSHL